MILMLALAAAPLISAQTAPFQQQLSLSMASGGIAGFTAVPVPAGMRLVIEYISISGIAPTGQKVSVSIQTTVSNVTADYSIVTQVQESADGTDRLVANQMMKIYADGPDFHLACWRTKGEGNVQLTFNISGHLEYL